MTKARKTLLASVGFALAAAVLPVSSVSAAPAMSESTMKRLITSYVSAVAKNANAIRETVPGEFDDALIDRAASEISVEGVSYDPATNVATASYEEITCSSTLGIKDGRLGGSKVSYSKVSCVNGLKDRIKEWNRQRLLIRGEYQARIAAAKAQYAADRLLGKENSKSEYNARRAAAKQEYKDDLAKLGPKPEPRSSRAR
jgi:hypothetical protein